jgi:GrpB-like predicted nucleotidyltransferase (UPF0157 family)
VSPADQVVLCEWRPQWGADFAELARALGRPLDGLALRIDHIGSTSVPGLRAKDVIDAQVVVRELDTEVIGAAFGRLGFAPRTAPWNLRDHVPAGWTGDPERWQKMVFAPPLSWRPSNVHVRVAGSPNERYALLFRDFLRANDGTRDAWGRFKTELAAVTASLFEYGAVKDPATDVLLALAERWAAEVGWTVGPPGTAG